MQLGLILLCLAFPLLELAVMIKVGQQIGVISTLLLLVGIGIAGGLILRAQGFAVMARAIEAARSGKPPIEPVVDGMFLMLAGVLFLIPGFLTDIAGALLLIPPVRRGFAHWMFSRMAGGGYTTSTVHVDMRGGNTGWSAAEHADAPQRPEPGAGPASRPDRGVVIDGEWERVDEPANRPSGKTPPRS